MRGQCLCGEVAFEIDENTTTTTNIYQCHCSLCRKVTGSACNSGVLVTTGGFQWLSGQGAVSSYIKDSGYRSDFCKYCGSPTPNEMRDGSGYWIPAGALEDTTTLKVTAHLCTQSKAGWDHFTSSNENYDSMPSLQQLKDAIARPNKIK
ncbi:GFA family protein [Flocculibacter collagenilyticus]|uniref:GFA family protein n=1 Tax=Flocculibacter collagenilyticus TaxID=2744479 RepID=UPI0018F797E1|nr:GFA family protein [Flocculibacter collagenilyticus]